MTKHRRSVDRRTFLRNTVGSVGGTFFLGLNRDSFSNPIRPYENIRLSNADGQDAKWEVAGRYVDACRCHVPCPCHFGKQPDYETCDAASVYQIENGHYKDVPLDGLLAIVVLSDFERFYLDATANRRQNEALLEIVRALTRSFLRDGIPISENLEIKSFPITASLSDSQAVVTIPEILEIQAASLTGGDGKSRIEMNNLDLGPGWMQSIWAGQSTVYTHSNGDRWDHSGRNSYFGRFRANSNMPVIQAVTDVRKA
jgi:hypothetical protein